MVSPRNIDVAKTKVTELLKAFGWSVVDLGGIESARYLEPLAMIWILLYIRTKTGNHAFKLLRQ
jgi:8-hydroxy-5-deazaflavin:NADPH oxidoreductase